MKTVYPLDDIDKAMIAQLRQDGRMAYGKLGQLVGLSEAAVRQRVHKLRKDGILQMSAILNLAELGFDATAYLGIRCSGDPRKVAKRIAKIPEVDYVITTAGTFDIMAEVVTRTSKELTRVLAEKIRPIPGIEEMVTNLILENHKLVYGSPLDQDDSAD